ncbi:hypothetical protein GSF08_09695 [Clostridiaceae bacterium DONG20-135]|uniref:Uncharacterized protein n=1 Tax=Copranaerobaculum intestinale TaxID=2692629 RepID=A0A6N8U7P4_9FIRM|nr:hypothetical protein [Copranaerobaculum intestinale]MXQ74208.1 hypothetical protein [Copranaerobaculum intestinale]
MQIMSEAFQRAISADTLQTRAYLDFEDFRVQDDGALTSIVIHDECYDGETDTIFGTFIGRYGEADIISQQNQIFEDKAFTPYFGVVLDQGEISYLSYGRMHVYECTRKEDSGKTTLKFIDDRLLFNRIFNFENLTYPMTWRQLLNEAAKQAGIQCSDQQFLNDREVIAEPVFFGLDATCADVVKAIAQASGTFAKITRTNQLELRKPLEESTVVLPQNYYTLETFSNYGPINSLVLGRDPQNDNVYLKDDEAIKRDGLHELRIVNNPLLDDRREALISSLYTALKDFSYSGLTCMMQGFPAFDCGDAITIKSPDDTSKQSYVWNHTLSFQGSLLSQIDAPTLTAAEIAYEGATSIEKKVLETELKVDKVKGEITSKVEETEQKIEIVDGKSEEYFKSLSNSMSQTMDSLNITVSQVEKNEEEVKSQLNSFTLSLDGLKNQFSMTGGNNIIEDSMGIFGTTFQENQSIWKGTYAVDHSTEAKKQNIYGYALMLMNDTLEQQIQVPNGVYTFSFGYQKHKELAKVSLVIDNEVIPLMNDRYTKVEKTIQVTANEISLKFVSDIDHSCTIFNLMGNQGEVASVYCLAPGESWNDYVKIGRGIEIGSDSSDVTFQANADTIGFKNKSGEYIAVFTDTGANMKEISIANRTQLSGILVQNINNQTVFNYIGVK